LNNPSEYTIPLLKMEHLENEYYCFDFKKPEGFSFVEGQFGVFGIVGKEIEGRKLRAFSIASTSDEEVIKMATRIIEAPSSYKEKLLALQPGELVTMNAPRGEFVLDLSRDAIFIAGGIGITPIRSMILSKSRNVKTRKDVLIYSELQASYPFKEELENLSNLEIHYAADIEPTQKAIIEVAAMHLNDAYYYLSGSPGFVKGLTGLLTEHGIVTENIKFDVFTGY